MLQTQKHARPGEEEWQDTNQDVSDALVSATPWTLEHGPNFRGPLRVQTIELGSYRWGSITNIHAPAPRRAIVHDACTNSNGLCIYAAEIDHWRFHAIVKAIHTCDISEPKDSPVAAVSMLLQSSAKETMLSWGMFP